MPFNRPLPSSSPLAIKHSIKHTSIKHTSIKPSIKPSIKFSY